MILQFHYRYNLAQVHTNFGVGKCSDPWAFPALHSNCTALAILCGCQCNTSNAACLPAADCMVYKSTMKLVAMQSDFEPIQNEKTQILPHCIVCELNRNAVQFLHDSHAVHSVHQGSVKATLFCLYVLHQVSLQSFTDVSDSSWRIGPQKWCRQTWRTNFYTW